MTRLNQCSFVQVCGHNTIQKLLQWQLIDSSRKETVYAGVGRANG